MEHTLSDTPVVTITFLKYKGFKNKWKAFGRMGQFSINDDDVEGLEFFKLLGSGGGNGFSIFPDWGVYAFLAVWNNEHSVYQGFQNLNSPLLLLNDGLHQWRTVYMKTMHAHGAWDGKNPFATTHPFDKQLPIGVITRATIKPSKMIKFWKFVPQVSRASKNKPGLIFSKGIGELPLVQQATFSLWESGQQMMDYAYRSKFHKEVIQKTRELGWYKEELFARFYPYKSEGNLKLGLL